jgi:uncharacterized protein YbcI
MTPVDSRVACAAAVAPLIERYVQYYLGRSPSETRVTVGDGFLLVAAAGVLTDAETRLLNADPAPGGRELIERLFRRMFRQSADVLTGTIETNLGVAVRAVMCDVDAAAGEAVIVVTFEGLPTVTPSA